MHAWSRPETRRALLLLMPSLIVLLSVVATTIVAASVQIESIRESTTARVRDVATSLAHLDSVHDALEQANADPASKVAERATVADPAFDSLQSLATLIERASDVAYVVVAGLDETRLTHPQPSERGQRVQTDTSPLRTGEVYVGTDTGPVGPTLRIKVPVFDDDGEVIGMVAVGVLEERLAARYEEALRELLPWEIGALVVGMLASSLISVALLRRFRRADDGARELDATRRVTLALREQSHEFDTRIHVIRGLLAHGDTADALDYVEEIAPRRGTGGAGETGLPPLPRATIDALRAELGAQGAALDVTGDAAADIDGDVTLVLANLCRNAAEAGATLVRTHLVQDGDRLRGTVEDDGPGIAEADVDRVVARGFSTKTDRADTVRGVGLDMVRRTVASRGGSLEVGRSELGGARFRFEMQVAP
ncbi:ATP-binding protein [Microbacterium sp. G2-8]|uniref:ATP-binding protein n=1 Tax=Microbacterium sp. G2-8 TaxID=2842454 RepID=UPI0027E297FC|nr:ATP-binding protein [Microbacterium sp. G2-8]